MEPTPVERIRADLLQRKDPKCWACAAVIPKKDDGGCLTNPNICSACKEPQQPQPEEQAPRIMSLILAEQCMKDDELERMPRNYTCYSCGSQEATFAGYCRPCKTKNEIRSAELPPLPIIHEKWMGSRRIEDVDTKGAL